MQYIDVQNEFVIISIFVLYYTIEFRMHIYIYIYIYNYSKIAIKSKALISLSTYHCIIRMLSVCYKCVIIVLSVSYQYTDIYIYIYTWL